MGYRAHVISMEELSRASASVEGAYGTQWNLRVNQLPRNDSDAGNLTRRDAAGATLYAAERTTEIALQTIQCFSGLGYTNDSPAGRLLRDEKLYEIGAGTSEIRRWLFGRELFEYSS